MSGEDEDDDFDSLGDESDNDEDIKNILNDLPLYKFYNSLENYDNERTVSALCKTLISSSDYDGTPFINLCEKLGYNLKTLSSIGERCRVSEDKLCDYVKYWVYDKVLDIDPKFSAISTFYTALTFIVPITSLKKPCTYDFYNYSRENFTKKKKLYDFLECYKSIKEKFNSHITNFHDIYCDHIMNSVNLYKDIERECIENDSCPYKEEYGRFKEEFTDVEFTWFTKNCHNKLLPCLTFVQDKSDLPCTHEVQIPAKDSQQKGEKSPVESDDSNDITMPALIPTATTLGMTFTLFTLFTLYKFTPVKTMLFSKNGIKGNIIGEEGNENLSYFKFEPDFTHSQSTPYRIAYHAQ
ncbi:PIR protein [Plasmodium ovale]|uniref:PIR protein n=1 Tax=Plasmodium ovale TaxID=36330 RepID=A0A1D3JDF6_PLAOA|nr:PIR protein [Plasmodium ovale]